jgi:hypothetical protein
MKPLKGKAYGSIPHLPGSRLGEGDHHCHEGQSKIATEKKRDKHDIVIVQEKLDGSNVAVAKLDNQIIALTRAGYTADTSPYKQHLYFDSWVNKNKERFYELLQEGERICGEWLLMAHGTRYNLPHEPFVAFDIMMGKERLTVNDFYERIKPFNFIPPKIISIGESLSIENMLKEIETSGHGAIDPVEGAVWRVERKGVVDFLCKYVRPYKQDGKYFSEITGNGEVWNFNVENL